MAEMCTLFPLVKGERSKLYEELYEFTGKDRRLTNFFYALSLQPEVQAQFSKKEKNSQGEVRSDDFIRKFKLRDFVAKTDEVKAERTDIGAIDSKGNPIEYDTPDELFDRVKEYNETHSRFKATIAYDNGKFVIKLDRVNAGNFRNSEVLETRMAQFKGLNSYLDTLGFSTDYTPETKNSIANFLNVRYFRNALFDMKGNIRDLSIPRANLLLDLMSGRGRFAKELREKFGDDAAEIVSFVSQGKDDARVDGYWKSIVTRLLEQTSDALQKLKVADLDKVQEGFVEEITPSTSEWFGVESDVLNSTLKDLYERYHLNQDLVSEVQKSLDSLSSVAKKLFDIDLTRLDILRHKEGVGSTSSKSKALRWNKREIDNGRYAQSIYSFLSDILEEFQAADEKFKGINVEEFAKLEGDEGDLIKLNEISKFIYENLNLISAYQPVIDALIGADALTLDQPDLQKEVLGSIKGVAKSINDLMSGIRSTARKAQFEAVVGLLAMSSWGTEDVKKMSSGEERSLRSIVQNLAVDPNMFDRLIYSINECNDAGLALVHNTIKARYRERDAKLREIDYIVRTLTEDLYKSGSESSVVFERDENGNLTGRLKSYVDFDKYNKEKKAFIASLREEGIRGKEFNNRVREWVRKNTQTNVTPFQGKNKTYNEAFKEYCIAIYGKVPTILNSEGKEVEATMTLEIPRLDKYFDDSALSSMSDAEYTYYSKMLALKAALEMGIPDMHNFFDAVQISGTMLNALKETGGDPAKLFQMVKNKFADAFSKREDDTDFGESFSDLLEVNGMKQAVMDLNGHEFMSIPIFFTHRLKDMTRLSTDFSRSMMAYAQTCMQYYEVNKISDALLLAEDYFKSREPVATSEKGAVVNVVNFAGKAITRAITKSNIDGASILSDLYEREIYGKKKVGGKTYTLFGLEVSSDKTLDWIIGYTSRTGLAVNLLGAQANLLVGKIQMFIESWAGEFFNLQDMAVAELKYFQYLPQYMNEYMSDNKMSFLGLLGQRFDVMEEFFRELQSKGFEKSAIGKILGNTNLFMLYGMGEHMLHFEGALSVLHHTEVWDKKTNNKVTLLKAMEDSYEENLKEAEKGKSGVKNLKWYFNYGRYEFIEKDREGNETRRAFTEGDMLKVEKQITYVNKSMHGAFNDMEKGLISRYALGRVIMNFRQWMPAHYQRRFRGRHYDADLGDDREGYYVSSWRFLVDCCKDLARGRVQIATRWEELSDMERHNLKRTIAELEVLVSLSSRLLFLGDYKDKKGNWAYRNLIYQHKRMLMEVQASTPIPDLLPLVAGKPANPLAFVDNIMQILNSPAAALKTVNSLLTMMDLTKLFLTVEGGKHEGENLYLHNLEKVAPYYGSILRQKNMGNEDYIFQVFE